MLLRSFALSLGLVGLVWGRPEQVGFTAGVGNCFADSIRSTNTDYVSCGKSCHELDACLAYTWNTMDMLCTIKSATCDLGRLEPAVHANDRTIYYRKGEVSCSTSNEGKEFGIAFMANRAGKPQDLDVELFLAGSNGVDAITRVTGNATGIPMRKATGELGKINLSYLVKMTDNGRDPQSNPGPGTGVIEQKGIFVTTQDDEKAFVLYGLNKERYTTDGFLALPVNALDRQYRMVCHSPPTYQCEFAVVGITDGTKVKVTLPAAGNTVNEVGADAPACNAEFQGRTYTNGDVIEFDLNRGQVFQLMDGCDLTGAFVDASKSVSAFSGNLRSVVGGNRKTRDHLVEQLPPVSGWGRDCMAWPTPLRTDQGGDTWVIMAADDNTQVTITYEDGRKENKQLSRAGSAIRMQASPERLMYIEGDKPIGVVSFVGSQEDGREDADPAMTICTPTQQYGFGYTFAAPTSSDEQNFPYKHTVSVVVKEKDRDGVLLDGRPISWSSYSDGDRIKRIPSTDWVVGFATVPTGTHTLDHADEVVTLAAFVYGAGDRESYAYPTGTCVRALTCVPQEEHVIADTRDNDCDGFTDEEVCGDELDNDGDGRIDEDCHRKIVIVKPTDKCYDVKESYSCYNSQHRLSCPAGTQVKIIDAHFGRIGYKGETSCMAENPVDDNGREIVCGLRDVYSAYSDKCDGEEACSQTVTLTRLGDILNPDSRCQLCSQYAWVHYVCAEAGEMPELHLAGRKGAQFADRYSASSWASGSKAVGQTCSENASVKKEGSCPGCSALTRSWTDDLTAPSSARFSVSSTHAWCPAFCDRDEPFITMDLGGHYEVTNYIIQGRRSSEEWAVKFQLAYSSDGESWTKVPEVLDAASTNWNGRAIKMCEIMRFGITARFMRAYIVSHSGQPCIHLDFARKAEGKGCPPKTIANSNFNNEPGALNSQSTVTCNQGMRTADDMTVYQLTCNGAGEWEGQVKECNKMISCPDIPQVPGALHNGRNSFAGTEVRYTCTNGSPMRGSSSTTCTNDGRWEPQPGSC